MINSKGQSFSVFELLIAAIVAVAILYVLLMVIPQPNFNKDPKTAIGDVLSVVAGGGSADTVVFSMPSQTTVRSEYFSAKGFDPCTIIFDKGKFYDSEIAVEANKESSGCTSYFVYKGVQQTQGKAKVVCALTPTALSSTLSSLGISIAVDPATLCGADGDYGRCCAVILYRS